MCKIETQILQEIGNPGGDGLDVWMSQLLRLPGMEKSLVSPTIMGKQTAVGCGSAICVQQCNNVVRCAIWRTSNDEPS